MQQSFQQQFEKWFLSLYRKFPIQDFSSKCEQICIFLQIQSHLLERSLMENFIFCAVYTKIIVTIILTNFIANHPYPFFVFVETKNENEIFSNLVAWYQKKCVLFITSCTLLQRHAEFNRISRRIFLTCYSYSYYSSMLGGTLSNHVLFLKQIVPNALADVWFWLLLVFEKYEMALLLSI